MGCRPIDEIKQFTMPRLCEGASEWYIEFYAYDPAQGKLRRKRIKINRISKVKDRRKYANELKLRLTDQLSRGWNPWVERSLHSNLRTFAEGCDSFEKYVDKMYNDGLYRKETYAGYKSYLKILRAYNELLAVPIYYAYQFDRRYCTDFLDYIFLERNNSAQTRNNYLVFLRLFSSHLVSRGFMEHKPTDGIEPISKRLITKTRTVIPPEVVHEISNYLMQHDRPFLLACYLLYYCYIRPVEITRLRLSYINVKDCTITIPAEDSKNKNTQSVTIPKKVLLFAVEMGVFGHPSDYYLFSDGLMPGREPIDPKIFRDHWAKVRRALHLRREYKFYSLKDTGITEMLDCHTASISVRDQARHASLSTTEIYTRHGRAANPELLEYDGSL